MVTNTQKKSWKCVLVVLISTMQVVFVLKRLSEQQIQSDFDLYSAAAQQNDQSNKPQQHKFKVTNDANQEKAGSGNAVSAAQKILARNGALQKELLKAVFGKAAAGNAPVEKELSERAVDEKTAAAKAAAHTDFLKKSRQKNCIGYNPDLVGNPYGGAFNIIVLAMDRPKSISRLFKSLQETEYLGHKINLYIKIDRPKQGPTAGYNQVVNAANNFKWHFGEKQVDIAKSNHGLAMSWMTAWNEGMKGNFIILEDDCEVSSCFYIWLQGSWNAYSHRDDISGISLQRQRLVPIGKKKVPLNTHEPFLYRLLGSGGFSPKPTVWRAWITWLREDEVFDRFDALDNTLDSMKPDVIMKTWYKQVPKGSMWTMHFSFFVNQHNLFCLYLMLPDDFTMVRKYNDNGIYEKGWAVDFKKLEKGEHSSVFQTYPNNLNRYGWDAKLETSFNAEKEIVLESVNCVFAGMIRNGGERLKVNLNILKSLGKHCRNAKYIIVENDSSDSTATVLSTYASSVNAQYPDGSHEMIVDTFTLTSDILKKQVENLKKCPFDVQCATTGNDHRPPRYSYIRNRYLELAKQSSFPLSPFSSPSFLIVMDLDISYVDQKGFRDSLEFMNGHLDIPAICSFGSHEGSPGQLGEYYDIFAFKSDKFPWDTSRQGAIWLHKDQLKKIRKHLDKEKVNGLRIPVESCFGPITIYRMSEIQNCSYSSCCYECEHVAFNSCARKENHMYIDPQWQSYYNEIK